VIRVALVTPYFPAHAGGVEIVAYELAKRLAAAGEAEITWHASDCDPPPAAAPGLRYLPARSSNLAERRAGFPYPLWSPRALAVLGRSVRDADVVHLHDCLYMPSVFAALAATRHARPLLVTQHIGMVPYRNPALRGLLALANRSVGRWLLGRASHVAFVSETVRRYFEGLVRFRSAPQVVANGVDTALFSPAERPPSAAPVLLFVGRFVEKKGLGVLQRLAGALPQVRWRFAGRGPLDPARWRLPNVEVLRGLGREELAAQYRSADLLVLPSVGEGFPLVVQEAMACGTPALVSEDTAAGYPGAAALLFSEPVGARDTAARWAQRIEGLLASPQHLRALRPRVAAFAREHWSWERCAERYAALLASCVTEKHSSSRLGKHSAGSPLR
jgi:glycosyltransferase involved in cell wall biosynthesis